MSIRPIRLAPLPISDTDVHKNNDFQEGCRVSYAELAREGLCPWGRPGTEFAHRGRPLLPTVASEISALLNLTNSISAVKTAEFVSCSSPPIAGHLPATNAARMNSGVPQPCPVLG